MMTEEEFLKRVEAKLDQVLQEFERDKPRASPMTTSELELRLDALTTLTGRDALALHTEVVRIKKRLARIEKALDIASPEPPQP